MEKPPYVVIDEAHKMESEATGAYSQSIQSKDIESIAKNLPQMVGPLYYLLGQEKNPDEALSKTIRDSITDQTGMLRDHVGPLFENIERFAKRLPNFTDIYWNEIKLLGRERATNAIEASIYNHLESLKFIFENVYKLLHPFTERWELADLENDDNKVTAWTTLESTISNVEDTYLTLMSLLSNADDLANTIKFHDEFGYELESAPINIGKLIYENISLLKIVYNIHL